MTPELEAKLKACTSLPSPPTVATRIIELANDPETGIDDVAKVISLDPAIASKILRIANSPLYSQRRQVENVQQAVLLLGLNGIISLALSFSLVKSLKKGQSGGLDYPLFWRRSLLSGSAGRAIGGICDRSDTEELFMASLLQDIGMLAIDRISPGLYAEERLDQTISHEMTTLERKHLAVDHSAIGGWLLYQWKLPERLQLAVASSADPTPVPLTDERSSFVRCVALSGLIADQYLSDRGNTDFTEASQKAKEWLQLNTEQFMAILRQMGPLITEAEQLFDIDMQNRVASEWILENAREALALRNMKTIHEFQSLKSEAEALENQFSQLQEAQKFDSLTGVYNRGYLDTCIHSTFQVATGSQNPLSIGFVDLDKFKLVNDTYGHQVGDLVLKKAACILNASLRGTDTVGRYGGEEFVVILPRTDAHEAQKVWERIITIFRQTTYDIKDRSPIKVTVSIGTATHSSGQLFQEASWLLSAADKALYQAKAQGGDRCVSYEVQPSSPLVGKG